MGITALLYAELCDAILPVDVENRVLIRRESRAANYEGRASDWPGHD